MKTMIPCATVYRLKLPDAETLMENLAEMELKPVGSHELASHGFVNVPWGYDLVAEFDSGFAFTLKSEERILPASAIKAALNKRCEEFEDEFGFKPGRKMLKELREEVTFTLLPKALVREVVTTCFYDKREGLLYVPSISDKRTGIVTSMLIKAVSAIELQTVVVDGRVHGISERLKNWLEGDDDSFGMFEPADHVVLSNDTQKVAVKRDSLSGSEAGILEALSDGFVVKEVGLTDGEMSFVLTNRFRLKSIKQTGSGVDSDPFQNAAVEVICMRSIVGKLLEMIGPAATPVDSDDDL